MPHYERGVYEPSDEVRVFDGTDDDEDVEGSRLPLLIVLALLVLAMFGGVVWMAYEHGVAQGRTETPVITAAAGPDRVAPQNPGGAQQPYQGFKIYEQPAPPDDDAAASPAPVAPVAAAAPPQPAPVAAAESPPKPAPVAATLAPAPAKPAPAPVKPAPAPEPVKVARAVPAPVAPVPVKPAPVAVKAAPQPTPLMIGPATAPPRALGTAATPVTAKPVAAAPVAAPAAAKASGSYVLQIGAYKSQADADAAWKAYKAKHAALLSGYNSDVQQADLGDKGTWYRLRIAGFSDKDIASGLCDRLKTDGGVCFLGK